MSDFDCCVDGACSLPQATDQLETLTFWVDGTAIPQGSKSIFRGRLVEANKKLRPWRAVVKKAAVEALAGRTGFTDAVYVSMDFYLPRGKTVRRLRPSVKPDVDKLARAVNDSLTDSGVLSDDGLIVDLHPRKWYADDQPGVRIESNRSMRKQWPSVDLIEEVQWFLSFGIHPEQICIQLNVKPSAVEKACARHGLEDAQRTFAALSKAMYARKAA